MRYHESRCHPRLPIRRPHWCQPLLNAGAGDFSRPAVDSSLRRGKTKKSVTRPVLIWWNLAVATRHDLPGTKLGWFGYCEVCYVTRDLSISKGSQSRSNLRRDDRFGPSWGSPSTKLIPPESLLFFRGTHHNQPAERLKTVLRQGRFCWLCPICEHIVFVGCFPRVFWTIFPEYSWRTPSRPNFWSGKIVPLSPTFAANILTFPPFPSMFPMKITFSIHFPSIFPAFSWRFP